MPEVINERLRAAGIALPKVASPVANYVPVVISNGQAYISGQITMLNGELKYVGQLGDEIDLETGKQAARLCGLNILAQLNAALGGLERVSRCIKLNVFVNSATGFTDQPNVANGASDLMVEVFGDAGRHARSAVGVYRLPFNFAVEVDAVVALS